MIDDGYAILDKRRLLVPSLDEAVAALSDLTVSEWAAVAGVALWIVLLCMPLTGIDRRDGITAATYALYLAIAGITLAIVVPGHMIALDALPRQVICLLLLAAIAAIRFLARPRPLPRLVQTQAPQKEKSP